MLHDARPGTTSRRLRLADRRLRVERRAAFRAVAYGIGVVAIVAAIIWLASGCTIERALVLHETHYYPTPQATE
jgi:ferric-dicitrate binding protein FerR (iron transport regulator)